MIWPFRRVHKKNFTPSARPKDTRITNTDHEDVIIAFLKNAEEHASTLDVGTDFTLTFPEEWREDHTDPFAFVAPIMMRAYDYGLKPGSCFNWNFTFTKRR